MITSLLKLILTLLWSGWFWFFLWSLVPLVSVITSLLKLILTLLWYYLQWSPIPMIFNSAGLLCKPLRTIPSAPIFIGIIDAFLFYNFSRYLVRSKYMFFVSFSFLFNLSPTGTAKSQKTSQISFLRPNLFGVDTIRRNFNPLHNSLWNQRKIITLMYESIICFFSFSFITGNKRMSWVRENRWWPKCTHAQGRRCSIFCETSLLHSAWVEKFPGLCDFLGGLAIHTATPITYTLHMDTHFSNKLPT